MKNIEHKGGVRSYEVVTKNIDSYLAGVDWELVAREKFAEYFSLLSEGDESRRDQIFKISNLIIKMKWFQALGPESVRNYLLMLFGTEVRLVYGNGMTPESVRSKLVDENIRKEMMEVVEIFGEEKILEILFSD